MLMCDIDDFKKLNDRLGHAEGDRCLVKVAGIIQDNVRRDRDHVARYGGEEFLVLLPGVSEQEAIVVAERIRESVEAAAFPNPASRVSRHVTLSIGVAVQTPADEAITPEQLQRQADAALYLAKQTGRNRVVLHRPESSANIFNRHGDAIEEVREAVVEQSLRYAVLERLKNVVGRPKADNHNSAKQVGVGPKADRQLLVSGRTIADA